MYKKKSVHPRKVSKVDSFLQMDASSADLHNRAEEGFKDRRLWRSFSPNSLECLDERCRPAKDGRY